MQVERQGQIWIFRRQTHWDLCLFGGSNATEGSRMTSTSLGQVPDWNTVRVLKLGLKAASPCLQCVFPVTQTFQTESTGDAELYACIVREYYSPRFPSKSRVNCIFKVGMYYIHPPPSLCCIIITQLLIINVTTDPLTIILNSMTFPTSRTSW